MIINRQGVQQKKIKLLTDAAVLRHYFLVKEQCFSLTTNQSNFSETDRAA
jgi:hypothetical protein